MIMHVNLLDQEVRVHVYNIHNQSSMSVSMDVYIHNQSSMYEV
jgi:hypothetical protein